MCYGVNGGAGVEGQFRTVYDNKDSILSYNLFREVRVYTPL